MNVERYYDGNGEPMLLADGYHSFFKVFGEDGFAASTSYYGTDGEPVINTKVKCHKVDRTYLDGSHYTSEVWFDTEGRPMTTGNTYCRIDKEFDEAKRVIAERYYDGEGNPIARKEGYDEIRQAYNEQGKVSRIEYFLKGELSTAAAGYAALEREYDGQGNIVCERYFNEKLEPTPCSQGYEVIRREYNEQKKVIRESYEDHTGAPMANNKGVYLIERTYDSNGTLKSETYISQGED